MKGLMSKVENVWMVKYPKYPTSSKVYETAMLPLHPHDLESINQYSKIFDNIDSRISANPEVQFIIVDEFSNPELFKSVGWGDGHECAKLIWGIKYEN